MSNTKELCDAIRSFNVSKINRLVSRGMTVNEVNALHKLDTSDSNYRYSHNRNQFYECTALHVACLVNNTSAIKSLLGGKGLDINVYSGFGSWNGVDLKNYTPLEVAAALKNKESFELLVQDERTRVVPKPDQPDFLISLLTDSNQDNHDMLIKLLAARHKNYEKSLAEKDKKHEQSLVAKQKSYDDLKNQFATMQKELTITVSKTDILKTTDKEVLKIHENNYGKLLESGKMTDFRIICGEEIFNCHKNILFAQSNVLKAMFNNDMRESREESMTITDLEPTILKLLLKFIYTGTIDLEEIKRNSVKLLEVADKYELDGLTKLCENELMPSIDNNNALEMIMNADLYHADRLKEVAMNWIVANKFEIVKQEGWKEVLLKFPRLVTDILEALTTKTTVREAETLIPTITELELSRAHKNNFGKLLHSGYMSDFKIISGEETFNCHKNILFAQSNILGTMLSNDIGEYLEDSITITDMEPEDSIIITDMEPAIVKLMIKFIYSGCIGAKEAKENATKLLEVSDRYDLGGLTKVCENELMPTVDNNNVLEMIIKADLFHADKLRKYAMKWIVANKAEIIKQEGWKEILRQFPILIDMLEVLTKK